jgi:putative ABC transport system substrate-binding protein
MRRRDFITVLVGATAWTSAARAQEPRRIGFLNSAYKGAYPGGEAAFLQGFKDAGFIEGGNISIEWRWAEGQYDRLPSLARELLGRNVVVIVAFDAPAAFAAKAATKTTPIVFLTGADPVATGLVESFSRPGNNLTGVSVLFSGVGPKRVEILVSPATTNLSIPVTRTPTPMDPRYRQRPTLSAYTLRRWKPVQTAILMRRSQPWFNDEPAPSS